MHIDINMGIHISGHMGRYIVHILHMCAHTHHNQQHVEWWLGTSFQMQVPPMPGLGALPRADPERPCPLSL